MTDPIDPQGSSIADDADPVIDALLAEFVPSTAQRLKRPPDLSAKILAQLAASPVEPSSSDRSVPDRKSITSASQTPPLATAGPALSTSSTVTKMVSLLVAVAACVFGVLWLASQPNGDSDQTQQAAGGQAAVGTDPSRQKSDPLATERLASDSGDEADPDDRRQNPIRGIQLDTPSLAQSDGDSSPATSQSTRPVTPKTQARPLTEVLAATSKTAREYWQALGIEPAAKATPDEIVQRLNRRLGINLNSESLSDPSRLRSDLAQSSVAGEIAKRWLASTAETGVGQIDRPENKDLIDQLAAGVAGKSRFDTTLVSLIDGSGELSDRWYETIGHGGTEAIAKRLAGISMSADLRCIKCHDSMIGRSGTQDDYWSFVALVRNVFQRSDNRWAIAPEPKSVQTFFELPDGRQRLATPKVSRHLLDTQAEFEQFDQWVATLGESGVLASSMVDSLWELVHGRHLKPSPVDAFAPPANPNLERLHRQLADDLQASDFDVARTLALIISSPMSNRAVPPALRVENILTVDEKDRNEALERVAAFAASVEPPKSSQKDRTELAIRRIGGSLQSGDQTMLAQPALNPGGTSNSLSNPRRTAISFAEQLSVDFPTDESPLPVSWLRSIEDYDQQVQHVVYLSGRERVSPELREIAKRLNDAGSTESALSRLWWILRD